MVAVKPRYAKPGSKTDKLHKLTGKVIKSGKHKGMKRVVLSKAGKKARAQQLTKKQKVKHHKKKTQGKKKK